MTASIETTELLEQRGSVYGDAVTTHERIAQVWTGIAGAPITGHQVALMMAGLKLVRAANGPTHEDSYDDLMGYGEIARRISRENSKQPDASENHSGKVH